MPFLNLKSAVLFLVLFSLKASSADLNLFDFRLQQVSVFQSYGFSFSGLASWNPALHVAGPLAIRACLGGTMLKGFSDNFIAAEYDIRLEYSLCRSLLLEAGGGAQTWFQVWGGTSPTACAGISWLFFKKIPGIRAGLHASYTLFMPSDNLTHEAGIGIVIAPDATKEQP